MIGVSVATLQNWDQGRRSHRKARSAPCLRSRPDPEAVSAALGVEDVAMTAGHCDPADPPFGGPLVYRVSRREP